MFSLRNPLGCSREGPTHYFELMCAQLFWGGGHELGELLVIVCGPVFSTHPGNPA